MGNPFILLQQSPSQLLSQLVFERQVHPDRLVLFRLCTGQTLESVIAENYPGLARLQGEHIFLSANSYLFPPPFSCFVALRREQEGGGFAREGGSEHKPWARCCRPGPGILETGEETKF